MRPTDLDALVRRANLAGHATVADYAANLEGAFLGLLFAPEKVDADALEHLAMAALGRSEQAA